MSSTQQNSVRVPIPPPFLGIFRDLIITFWNYVIASANSIGKNFHYKTKVDNLMEYIEFSDIDSVCEVLTEIIKEKSKNIFNDSNLIKLFDKENYNNYKNDLLKLCKYSLRLQEKSKIEFDNKNNITVILGAEIEDFEKITNSFRDIVSYSESKQKSKKGKGEKTLQIAIKNLNINLEYKGSVPETCGFEDLFQRVRYAFARGYAIEKIRGKQGYGEFQLKIYASIEKEKKEKKKEKSNCEKLIYEIPVFIRIIQQLTKVKGGAGIYILMSEIYEGNHEILSHFFYEELENLKEYVDEIMNIFNRANTKESPPIYSLLQEYLLLKIISEFLEGSIAYTYNWPSLRIYYLPPELKRAYIVIDLPPSLIEIAKLALISSAKKLHMSPRTLLSIIFKLIRINKEGAQSGISINDLHIFIHTILQGNPDIDLFYKLERASYLVEGAK